MSVRVRLIYVKGSEQIKERGRHAFSGERGGDRIEGWSGVYARLLLERYGPNECLWYRERLSNER